MKRDFFLYVIVALIVITILDLFAGCATTQKINDPQEVEWERIAVPANKKFNNVWDAVMDVLLDKGYEL